MIHNGKNVLILYYINNIFLLKILYLTTFLYLFNIYIIMVYTKEDIINFIEVQDLDVVNTGLEDGFYNLEIYHKYMSLEFDLDGKIKEDEWNSLMDEYSNHDNIIKNR
jgi:hypothetical protein